MGLSKVCRVITALDNNVLSSILSRAPHADALADLLDRCSRDGALTVSDAVYCELRAYPDARADFIEDFLRSTLITVDWTMNEVIWKATADAFAIYADRRRKSRSGTPKRLVTDFLIGAHAATQADRFLTFDKRLYASYFPHLQLVEFPSQH